jgi:hypothetical protein
MIIGTNFKLSPFGRNPTYYIFISLPYSERIQQLKVKKRPNPSLINLVKKYISLKISIFGTVYDSPPTCPYNV